MAHGPISGLDKIKPKYLRGEEEQPKGRSWPPNNSAYDERRKKATMSIRFFIPQWFYELLPLCARTAVVTAAIIRGTRKVKRVKWGVVTWYTRAIYHNSEYLRRIENHITLVYLTPEEYQELVRYQLELCIPTVQLAALSAMLVGTNIIAARWGITAPSRTYPFRNYEWKTLLRMINIPYKDNLSHQYDQTYRIERRRRRKLQEEYTQLLDDRDW